MSAIWDCQGKWLDDMKESIKWEKVKEPETLLHNRIRCWKMVSLESAWFLTIQGKVALSLRFSARNQKSKKLDLQAYLETTRFRELKAWLWGKRLSSMLHQFWSNHLEDAQILEVGMVPYWLVMLRLHLAQKQLFPFRASWLFISSHEKVQYHMLPKNYILRYLMQFLS